MKVCRPRRHVILARVALASGFLVAPSLAETRAREAHAKRVLVMSLDGLHAVDLARYVKAKPNSALAELARQGITYSNAWQPVGDLSPGLLAIATGGSGVSTGIIYSPTYDRALAAAGSNCEKRGTLLTIDNKLNKDLDAEDAGGGFDVSKLPRDAGGVRFLPGFALLLQVQTQRSEPTCAEIAGAALQGVRGRSQLGQILGFQIGLHLQQTRLGILQKQVDEFRQGIRLPGLAQIPQRRLAMLR